MTPFSLGFFASFSPLAWHADSDRQYGRDWWTGQAFIDLARRLEEAKFDYIFFQDTLSVSRAGDESMDGALRLAVSAPTHDPVVLLSALARATEQIGLVATASTSFYPPYTLARAFGTLDCIAEGRIGWNIVTSVEKATAQNYGLDTMPSASERYDRADEYVEVARKLWDSWDEGALVADEESNVYIDSSKVHSIDHDGRYFSVRGPLNILRSPQGHPLLVQAGASDRGRDFAAKNAELIFVHTDVSVAAMRELREDIRARAAKFGRDPDDIKVVFAAPVTFTEEEWDPSQGLPVSDVQLEAAVLWLSLSLDHDLSRYLLDEPFPTDIPASGVTSMFDTLVAMSKDGLTLRDSILAMRYSTPEMSFIGTPEQVAERLATFIDGVGGDGVMIIGTFEMNGAFLENVTGRLVPALRAIGAIREEYDGATLRSHLWPERELSRAKE